MTATAQTPEHGSPDGAEPEERAVHLLPPLGRELSTPAEVAEYLEHDLSEWLDVLTDAAAYHVSVPDMLPLDVSSVLAGVAEMLRTGAPLRIVDGSCDRERAACLGRLLHELLNVDASPKAPDRPAHEVCTRTLLRLARTVAEAAERIREEA